MASELAFPHCLWEVMEVKEGPLWLEGDKSHIHLQACQERQPKELQGGHPNFSPWENNWEILEAIFGHMKKKGDLE